MSRHRVAVLLFTSLATACGGGDADDTSTDEPTVDAAPPDASPACAEAAAEANPTLTWVQAKIFDKSCSAFNDCHKGAASQAGDLNLESGNSYAALVDVDSNVAPGWKLVVPGDVDQSYLMVLLGLVDGPIDPDVGTMPGGTNPTLCVEKQEAVARWIAAGAMP